jgi:hypothetical protein
MLPAPHANYPQTRTKFTLGLRRENTVRASAHVRPGPFVSHLAVSNLSLPLLLHAHTPWIPPDAPLFGRRASPFRSCRCPVSCRPSALLLVTSGGGSRRRSSPFSLLFPSSSLPSRGQRRHISGRRRAYTPRSGPSWWRSKGIPGKHERSRPRSMRRDC